MQFTRRYTYWPGTDELTKIEGMVIIDLDQPSPAVGTSTGIVAIVGEFADMARATSVNGAGIVSTQIEPLEISGSTDFLEWFGGFDSTLGDWGTSHGNGYASVARKKFSRMVLAPVNLCATRGMRVFRQLPVCNSQTDASSAVVITGTVIAAGTEFRNAGGRMKTGTAVQFTSLDPIATGTGGSCTVGASAATQTFSSGTLDWTTIARPDGSTGARIGDIIVVGYNNGGAIAPAAEGGTYRVVFTPTSGTNIVVERLDGANFAWSAQANVPWRLHVSSDADSAPVIILGTAGPGGYSALNAGGYSVPARPLTDSAGAATDGLWAAGLQLTPATVPTGMTGGTWYPQSGLAARCHVTDGIAFVAALSAPNAVSSATIDAAYVTAINATISAQGVLKKVALIASCRQSATIRAALRSNALTASGNSYGRMAILAPELSVLLLANAEAASGSGAGVNRDERVAYSWPGYQEYVPEAVGTRLKRSDGSYTSDGMVDMPADMLLMSVLSVLPPERNPGQEAPPVPELLAIARDLQKGAQNLDMTHYIRMKAAGICGLNKTEDGIFFQSGVTTSLVSGKKNIFRRRMTDYIQDSLTSLCSKYVKIPPTRAVKDDALATIDAFMADLLGEAAAGNQRIKAYVVDDKSGNNSTTEAAGVHVVIVRGQLLAPMDVFAIATQVGENVDASSREL